jgi:hypothetical protein
MGKIKKSFREYSEENEELRKKRIKKESRHNFKTHLMDVIENEDWDELEEELDEQGRIHRR